MEFFFFNDTATTEIYTLSLHDALPILLPSDHTTYCEWKGAGSYYDLLVNGKFVHDAAWYYDKPMRGFEAITGYPAFYAQKMDKCLIDGVEVKPQPGGFYGGWITPDIVGPFKGEEGTWGW